MGIFSWFSKPAVPDYETVLSRLSSEINDAKVHLSEIRLRERRSALLISLYGLGLWALWAGLWWVGGLPFGLLGWDKEGLEFRIVGAAGVGVGPVFIWALNRLLGLYFTRQRNAEEKHLRKLLAEQRKQLDAIKKATNYDSTRKLIELYDEHTPSSASPSPQANRQPQPMQTSSNPVTPIRQGQVPAKASPKGTPRAPGHLAGVSGTPQASLGLPGTPIQEGMTPEQAAALHLHMQAIQPVLPTPEKKWYDRVVDNILGDDPSQAPQSKYALVCGECFRHNGLVGGKYEWERMQWICPRCNHMNLPPISKNPSAQQGQGTPTSTPTHTYHAVPSSTPTTPSHKPLHPAPRPRRGLSDRGTPRSSKLQEVFSAADDEGEGEGEEGGDDRMDVDEHK